MQARTPPLPLSKVAADTGGGCDGCGNRDRVRHMRRCGPGAFAQTPGPDPNSCPGIVGTIAGCPDSDSDGVADLADNCPTIGDTTAPDYFSDGCPDAVFGVRYQVRIVRRGLRVTRIRLVHIAGFREFRVTVDVSCRLGSGKRCWGGTQVVRLGRELPRDVYPPGARLSLVVASLRRSGAKLADIECHRLTIGGTSTRLKSFRGPEEMDKLGRQGC